MKIKNLIRKKAINLKDENFVLKSWSLLKLFESLTERNFTNKKGKVKKVAACEIKVKEKCISDKSFLTRAKCERRKAWPNVFLICERKRIGEEKRPPKKEVCVKFESHWKVCPTKESSSFFSSSLGHWKCENNLHLSERIEENSLRKFF